MNNLLKRPLCGHFLEVWMEKIDIGNTSQFNLYVFYLGLTLIQTEW